MLLQPCKGLYNRPDWTSALFDDIFVCIAIDDNIYV